MPVIGFLNSASPEPFASLVDAFRQGLKEGGYVEGRNVAIEYRWANGQYSKLPELAADLLSRKVALIAATGGSQTARAVKAITSAIPILFVGGPNPVGEGLVGNFNRPGGNLTGAAVYSSDLIAKRLELLTELVPRATRIALLHNPTGFAADAEAKLVQDAANSIGRRAVNLQANTPDDLATAFASATQLQVDAMLIGADPFFNARRSELVAYAKRYALPTAYPWREYVEQGGLMSYGSNLAWAYRLIGRYASRILNGEKAGDLPVQLPTKFELVINARTVKSLGLEVPLGLFVAADELID
ncbi:MAG: ABC transporter substrate-binding protein [Proteobacteria bacterium]|nr:MAG: ABC transporter substrate-binding protein [Pseudomonadota bacterium]